MIDLKQIFQGDYYWSFYIENLKFSFEELKSIVRVDVGHYVEKRGWGTKNIRLTFRDVCYHSVMSESYISFREEDDWEENLFVAKASSSQLIPSVASYTLLGAEAVVELSNLSHYRVYGTNHFVDIICTEEPSIIIQDETYNRMQPDAAKPRR